MEKNKNQYKLSCVNCSQLCRNHDLNLFVQSLRDYQNAGFGEAIFGCATITGQTEAINSLLGTEGVPEPIGRLILKA